MDIVVADSAVLIDLERAGLEDIIVGTGHRWVVPDLLYAMELEASTGPDWRRRGLHVVELSPEEVTAAQQHYQQHRPLSLVDSFAFSLCVERRWILVTRGATLHRLAVDHSVDCHGMLWVIKLAHTAGFDVVVLEQGVRQLLAQPRCRLPRRETDALLRQLLGS